MHIRIIATPPGEAPDAVREKWVGLVLKVHGPSVVTTPSIGVLSAKSFWKQLWATVRPDMIRGYKVESAPAIAALRLQSPAAAVWWESNLPDLLQPGQLLVFHEEVCELVGDSERLT